MQELNVMTSTYVRRTFVYGYMVAALDATAMNNRNFTYKNVMLLNDAG